jgi:PIN domain nuclease of toxin-antitoxin system
VIVLDTHVWLWQAAAPDRLSPAARSAIADATEVLVSTASCLEVAALVRKGRIALDRDVMSWVRTALAVPRFGAVDTTAEIATRAGSLPDPFPGDPADRLIYASALVSSVPLVTRDEAIRRFDPARTIW